MDELRATMRVNIPLALVVLSLVAEFLFVVLLAYGGYRLIELFT